MFPCPNFKSTPDARPRLDLPEAFLAVQLAPGHAVDESLALDGDAHLKSRVIRPWGTGPASPGNPLPTLYGF